MSDTVFVRETLCEVYTVQRFGSKKAAQIAAYEFLKRHISERPLTLRRVRAFFEGKARIIRGEEKDAVRAAKVEEARREYGELRARLESLDETLAVLDQDVARASSHAVGQ